MPAVCRHVPARAVLGSAQRRRAVWMPGASGRRTALAKHPAHPGERSALGRRALTDEFVLMLGLMGLASAFLLLLLPRSTIRALPDLIHFSKDWLVALRQQ
jgi:hypothetical protein